MDFVTHPSNNHHFGAPPDWDKGDGVACGTLPVTLTYVDGRQAIVSFWKPDATELAKLLQGKPVVLTVFGRQHPVVSMGVLA